MTYPVSDLNSSFFYTGTALWPMPANKTKIWSSSDTAASCTCSKLRMEADWHRPGWPPSLFRQGQQVHHCSHWLLHQVARSLCFSNKRSNLCGKSPLRPLPSPWVSWHHYIGPRKGILQPGVDVPAWLHLLHSITDNHNSTLKVSDVLLELTGVEHRVTSAYHPQTNGLTERFNQTLKDALIQVVNEQQNDWDLQLPSLQLPSLQLPSLWACQKTLLLRLT